MATRQAYLTPSPAASVPARAWLIWFGWQVKKKDRSQAEFSSLLVDTQGQRQYEASQREKVVPKRKSEQ